MYKKLWHLSKRSRRHEILTSKEVLTDHNSEPGTKSRSGGNWRDTFCSLEIDSPIKDERAFKAQLGIGEDVYLSSRMWKFLREQIETGGVMVTGGAIAALPVVATTFFPAGGILGIIGLGTATTPVGWVIGFAVVSGVIWKFGKGKIDSAFSGRIEVIPEWLNTPLDVLAVALFDLLAPLVLKVAAIDGEIHEKERKRINDYFVNSWGYDPRFIEFGISCVEDDFSNFRIMELSKTLKEFTKSNPDCNYEFMANKITGFLQELIETDGRIQESEELALSEVKRAFNRGISIL